MAKASGEGTCVRYPRRGRGSVSTGTGQLLGLSATTQVFTFNPFAFGASEGWKDQTQHAQPTGQGEETTCFALAITAGSAHAK